VRNPGQLVRLQHRHAGDDHHLPPAGIGKAHRPAPPLDEAADDAGEEGDRDGAGESRVDPVQDRPEPDDLGVGRRLDVRKRRLQPDGITCELDDVAPRALETEQAEHRYEQGAGIEHRLKLCMDRPQAQPEEQTQAPVNPGDDECRCLSQHTRDSAGRTRRNP